jgi:hypothetical protein
MNFIISIISKVRRVLNNGMIDDEILDYYKDNYVQVEFQRKSSWSTYEGYIVQYSEQYILFYEYRPVYLSIDGLRLIRRKDCKYILPSLPDDDNQDLILACLQEYDLLGFLVNHDEIEIESINQLLLNLQESDKYVDIYIEDINSPYVFCKIDQIDGEYVKLKNQILGDQQDYIVSINEITMINWNSLYHDTLPKGIKLYRQIQQQNQDPIHQEVPNQEQEAVIQVDAVANDDAGNDLAGDEIIIKNKLYQNQRIRTN